MTETAIYEQVIEELAISLRISETKMELRECVIRLFSEEFVQLVKIALNDGATRMTKGSIFLQPADALLKLLAAVRANDVDAALAIEQGVRSLA